jgi:hypothetical protein
MYPAINAYPYPVVIPVMNCAREDHDAGWGKREYWEKKLIRVVENSVGTKNAHRPSI